MKEIRLFEQLQTAVSVGGELAASPEPLAAASPLAAGADSTPDVVVTSADAADDARTEEEVVRRRGTQRNSIAFLKQLHESSWEAAMSWGGLRLCPVGFRSKSFAGLASYS